MPTNWTEGDLELVAQMAYHLQLQGKYGDARILLEGLLAIDPVNVYSLQALAWLSLTLHSAEKALDFADRALAISPYQVEALAAHCEANILLNRLPEARQDINLLGQLRAITAATRLTMRLANAEKSSSDLLTEATLPERDR